MYTFSKSSGAPVNVNVPVAGNTIEPVMRNEKLSVSCAPAVVTASAGPPVAHEYDSAADPVSPVAMFDGVPLKLLLGHTVTDSPLNPPS